MDQQWKWLARKVCLSGPTLSALIVAICNAFQKLMLRSVQTTPQLRCVAAPHRPAQKLRRDCIAVSHEVKPRWLAVVSNCYICTATQCNVSINEPLARPSWWWESQSWLYCHFWMPMSNIKSTPHKIFRLAPTHIKQQTLISCTLFTEKITFTSTLRGKSKYNFWNCYIDKIYLIHTFTILVLHTVLEIWVVLSPGTTKTCARLKMMI